MVQITVVGSFWLVALSVLLLVIHSSPATGQLPAYYRRLLQASTLEEPEAHHHKTDSLLQLEVSKIFIVF